MKKWLKPGFSIFLASLLVLSLALPGYAAGKDGKSKTSNLALEKISEMPKEKNKGLKQLLIILASKTDLNYQNQKLV